MLKGFQRVARQLSRISTKPIVAVESASDGTGGDKASWIAEGYRRVYEALPQVVAVIYLDVDLRDRGHPDWSLAVRRRRSPRMPTSPRCHDPRAACLRTGYRAPGGAGHLWRPSRTPPPESDPGARAERTDPLC
jgi:hypothetical protein